MSAKQKILIKGPTRLSGKVTPIANKNSIMAALPVCLLTKYDVIYQNLPKTSDVQVMLEILQRLGAKVVKDSQGKTIINTKNIANYEIPTELSSKNRASIMFLGPLFARFGQAEIGEVGGCKLGKRPFDDHLLQLSKFGGKTTSHNNKFGLEKTESVIHSPGLIWLREPSVTVTENIIMAASLVEEETVIYNAACEPNIVDLCQVLENMGVSIQGAGTNKVTVTGKYHLKGTTVNVRPDFLDIGALIAAAYVTGGELTINGVRMADYQNIIQTYQDIGIQAESSSEGIFVPAQSPGYIRKDLLGRSIKIKAEPWPGFPVDLIPIIIIASLFSKGQVIIQNHMFDNALDWTDQLQKMGAIIYQGNPMEVCVTGPSKLTGTTLSSKGIIQAGVAMFIAGLAAKGETVIEDAEAICRRYPDIVETFGKLGADVSWQ